MFSLRNGPNNQPTSLWARYWCTITSAFILNLTCHQDLSPDKASHTCCAHCTHPPFLSNVPYSHCSSPTSVSSPGFILHSSLLFSLAPDHLSLRHRLLCNLGQHTPISEMAWISTIHILDSWISDEMWPKRPSHCGLEQTWRQNA